MQNKILVICPSRERAKMAETFIKSWKETNSGFSDIVLMLDDDDETLSEYKKIKEVKISITDVVRKMVREGRCGMKFLRGSAQSYNKAYELYPDYKYYAILSDDMIFRTKNWDKIVIDKFKETGDFGLVYGDDLASHKPVAPFISANLIKIVGYFCPLDLIHLRLDRIWWGIAKFSKTIYRVPIIIEHMHPRWKKREYDDTYTLWKALCLIRHDKAVHRNWQEKELPKILENIKKAL